MQPRLALNLLHSQGALELLILLPPAPKSWDYRNVPPYLVYVVVLGIKERFMPDKNSIN